MDTSGDQSQKQSQPLPSADPGSATPQPAGQPQASQAQMPSDQVTAGTQVQMASPQTAQPSPAQGKPFDMAQGKPSDMAQGKPSDMAQGKPSGEKEAEFVSGTTSIGESEKIPIIEMKEPGELPVEVEGWLERAEKDDVAEPPTIVHQGQPVVSPADPQQVSVTLPLDEEELKKGLEQKLADSLRWLAEWTVRIIKKLGGRVRYKEKV